MSIIDKAATAAWEEALRQNLVTGRSQNHVDGNLDMAAMVRAIVKAVREPDERMEQSGAEVIRNVSKYETEDAFRSDAANTWRFMIDEALAER